MVEIRVPDSVQPCLSGLYGMTALKRAPLDPGNLKDRPDARFRSRGGSLLTPPSSICGKRSQEMRSNTRRITFPREVVAYIAQHLTTGSPPEIGRPCGDKHASRVTVPLRGSAEGGERSHCG